MLHYRLPGGGYLLVRPSGTEPKIKLYFSVAAPTEQEAAEALAELRRRAVARVDQILRQA